MIEYAYISLPEELGQAVRAARKDQGLSQTELAHRSGCSQRFVSEFERGKPGAELGKVLQLISALGLTVQLSSARTVEQNRREISEAIARIESTACSAAPPRKKLADYLGE
ncbi:MAG: helix-turn-helix transcriptional regulator [Coriobacteriaceae bacterium]|nr:helix-turn-helix transcriptional regulator [Coriobacteriaceae bacterium]